MTVTRESLIHWRPVGVEMPMPDSIMVGVLEKSA